MDRGDALPLGQPQLMTSFTSQDQFTQFEDKMEERNRRYGIDSDHKEQQREYIQTPNIDSGTLQLLQRRTSGLTAPTDADVAWKTC